MNSNIPSSTDLKHRLDALGHAEVQELSRISGVPFTTLLKIRSGETGNPRIDTVRAFAAHLTNHVSKVE